MTETQVFRPDFDAAIRAAEANRLTHVHWRDWRKAGHGTEEDHPNVGDLAHHEEAIAEYDNIIACLRRALADRQEASRHPQLAKIAARLRDSQPEGK